MLSADENGSLNFRITAKVSLWFLSFSEQIKSFNVEKINNLAQENNASALSRLPFPWQELSGIKIMCSENFRIFQLLLALYSLELSLCDMVYVYINTLST